MQHQERELCHYLYRCYYFFLRLDWGCHQSSIIWDTDVESWNNRHIFTMKTRKSRKTFKRCRSIVFVIGSGFIFAVIADGLVGHLLSDDPELNPVADYSKHSRDRTVPKVVVPETIKEKSKLEMLEPTITPVKKQMVEKSDEVVEGNDSAMKKKDSTIEKKDSAIEKKDSAIEKKDSAIKKKDSTIEKKDALTEKKDEHVVKEDKKVDEQEEGFRFVTFEVQTEAEMEFYALQKAKVNDFKFRSIIKGDDLCMDHPVMVIMVKSLAEHIEIRQTIRETWGSVAKGQSWPSRDFEEKVELVFVFGFINDIHLRDQLFEESQKHRDIIQGDFPEAYNHLTDKSLYAMQWAMNECNDATYYMQADEDMFVNLPYIFDVLKKWEKNTDFKRTIMGPHMGTPMVGRGRGKWSVSKDVFPFKQYPPYEAGTAYIITMDIIDELVNAAYYVPSLHIDDVYVTGILGAVIGLKHAMQPGFGQLTRGPLLTCDVVEGKVLSWHNTFSHKLKSLWHRLEQGIYNC